MFLLPRFTQQHIDSESIESVSLLGTVHRRRWRWNPFESALDMVKVSDTTWRICHAVDGPQPPDVNGLYSLRLVLNHSHKRQLKTSLSQKQSGIFDLIETDDGRSTYNIHFRVDVTQLIVFEFDSQAMQLTLTPSAGFDTFHHIDAFDSFQLNGFPWDSLNMFDKFDPRLKGREFVKQSDDLWSIDIPLLKTGGIDFRADGVYQFLISANHDEDFGFSALNDGQSSLIQGTGFGSSHGSSIHSGCTIQVFDDGEYRFNLHNPLSESPKFSVVPSPANPSLRPPDVLNERKSFQLLGSIFEDNQFDPTDPDRLMKPIAGSDKVSLNATVKSGFHVVNIGISSELFLDTMGLGCWLDINDGVPSSSLECVTWHGKPHELNICFKLDADSDLDFVFDPETDRLSIRVISGPGQLIPISSLESMSLVGSFDDSDTLEAWNPESPLNLMNPLQPGCFDRVVPLIAGKTYNYKYVANRSPWALVYADYELDCYGFDFSGSNPDAADPSKRSLKRFGQLTSHGNPPALEFIPSHTGNYRFFVDVVHGGYSVRPYS